MTYEIAGFNFAGRGQNQGMVFVRFKDWSQRKASSLSVQAVLGRTAQHFASYQTALIIPINPPSIPALGTSSGFDLELEDQGGIGHARARAGARPADCAWRSRTRISHSCGRMASCDNPTYRIDIDREKASALGVNLNDVDQTFSIAWGSKYVNNFLDTDGRIKRVYVQADAPFRMNPEDLGSLYVRNSAGTMVPFTSFATGHWDWGSPKLERYNGVSAFEIQGQAAPGQSTGQAMAEMQRLMPKLPAGVGYEWTGMSLQEVQSASQAPYPVRTVDPRRLPVPCGAL